MKLKIAEISHLQMTCRDLLLFTLLSEGEIGLLHRAGDDADGIWPHAMEIFDGIERDFA